MPFADLNTFYRSGQEVRVHDLPAGTARVAARSAAGTAIDVGVGVPMPLGELGPGTHALEAWSAGRRLLAEELTTIGCHAGERPVMGFVTSFDPAHVAPVLQWLRALRCTVVQHYDWMASYSAPLGTGDTWSDPLGRPVSRSALVAFTHGLEAMGATAQAYAPVYASDPRFAGSHPGWRLYRGDGQPQSLGDLLEIMDPANPDWLAHWLEAYGAAADTLGFGGFHLDSYGYPRAALDAQRRVVKMKQAYEAFLRAVRAARPRDLLSFNQVNGVPRELTLPGPPGFRYSEVWAPNERWRHIEGLLDRSAERPRDAGDTLALYPPVWGGERRPALHTGLLSEAVATVLGANLLIWGDDRGVLRDAYYPAHETLNDEEAGEVLEWHRFALRCRDLFAPADDTSWYEIGDDNGSVSVAWRGPVSPEPTGGAVFARVVRTDHTIAVSVLDLSGSPEGRWTDPTGEGKCQEVEVSVLVDVPERWAGEAAILGRRGGRFSPIAAEDTSHREGRALKFRLPVDSGWSVLRVNIRSAIGD